METPLRQNLLILRSEVMDTYKHTNNFVTSVIYLKFVGG